MAAGVTSKQLKDALTYPAEWGPSDWGPIPFLPEPDILVNNMEASWGDLDSYRGISTSASGASSLAVAWQAFAGLMSSLCQSLALDQHYKSF